MGNSSALTLTAALLTTGALYYFIRRPVEKPKRKKSLTKKFPGLLNIGNSCYFNSCLQLLASSRVLLEHPELNHLLRAILIDLNCEQLDVVDPRPFLKCFLGTILLAPDQQDAHELLLALLSTLRLDQHKARADLVNDAMKNILDFQKMAPYKGLIVSRLLCSACKEIVSYRLDPVTMITIEPRSSIKSSLDHFQSYLEPITGYKCASCHQTTMAYKQQSILKAPQILLIHVNRIKSDGFGRISKDDTKVLPDQLINFNNNTYRLKSLIEHTGSVNHGHYVAYRGRKDCWQLISDSTSSIITSPSQYPYILLYECTT